MTTLDQTPSPSHSSYAFQTLALDFDGTLTTGGVPDGAVLRALCDAREHGLRLILVTGRIMAELRSEFPDVDDRFDAIVVENGGAIYAAGRRHLLATPVDQALVRSLRAAGIDARAGEVLTACQGVDAPTVVDHIHRLGLDCQVLYNRAALMVLPAGVTKGTGLQAALRLLGLSVHSAVGIGDAENDLALLQACELGVAVANSVDSLRDHADLVTVHPDGHGVIELLEGPELRGERIMRSPHRRLQIGTSNDGLAVTVPASHANLLVIGASGSGKSFVGGLFAERLIDAGYTALVIDYEGDHTGLQTLPEVVVLGGTRHLPDPYAVCALLANAVSVVVDLSMNNHTDQDHYVALLEKAITGLRSRCGLPDWLVIDEAHRSPSAVLPLAQSLQRGCCFLTWRPDRLPPSMTERLDIVLVVAAPLGPDAAVSSFVESWHDSLFAGCAAADGAELGTAVMLDPAAGSLPLTVTLLDRASEHVRHQHKYAVGDLPLELRFSFRGHSGALTGATARNLREFALMIAEAEDDVVRHHLGAHDFSAWILQAIRDQDLSAVVAQIETQFGETNDVSVARARTVDAIRRRY